MAYIPGSRRRSHRRRERGERPKKEESAKYSEEAASDLDIVNLKRAYRELEAANRSIREAQIDMILSLAQAAEYKDPDTGNHILRISDYATELARAAGLPETEVELIRYASPMHDIGKIGIPDNILQKPGKFTEKEWAVMKTHTEIGSRIFRNAKSGLLKAASEIALTHHERYDGSGYPNGLKGEAIPISGRIVALVDIFDAIVSKRCYKEESSFEEGVAYIQSLAGTHLDPRLVDLFVKIKPVVRKIYDANTSIQAFIENYEDRAKDSPHFP